MVAVLEVNYSTVFHYLSDKCFPPCSNLIDRGYYLNFRTGVNNYFKCVWFDFNGYDKVIIRTPDHRYRNIYLSKVKDVKVCFIADFNRQRSFRTDRDVIKEYGVDFRVKVEDLYDLFLSFQFHPNRLKNPNLLVISAFMNGGEVYNFVIEESADFSYNFRTDLKKWYLALICIRDTLNNYRSLSIDDFNIVLKREFPFSNKIKLCKNIYKFKGESDLGD